MSGTPLLGRATRAVYVLSFLGDACVGLFSFALSLFTAVMLGELGITGPGREFWVATVSMGWGIAYVVAPVVLGNVSDTIGRKPAVITGMSCFILLCVLVPQATLPWHLLVAFACAGACFGFFFPVLGALSSEIGEATGGGGHATVVSRFMIAWSIGLTAGPFLGGIFNAAFDHLVSFGVLALVAGSIIAIAVALVPGRETMKRMVHDVDAARARHEGPVPAASPTLLASILLMPVVFSIANHVIFTIFPAYAVEHVARGPLFGSMDMSFVAGFLTFLLGAGRTLSFWHAGKARPASRRGVMVIAPGGMCAGMFLIYLFPVAEVLLPAFILYGVSSGYTFSIGLILLMELSRSGKGLRAGLYEAAVGAGTLGASIFAMISGQVHPALPFLVASACCGVVFLVLVVLWRLERDPRGVARA